MRRASDEERDEHNSHSYERKEIVSVFELPRAELCSQFCKRPTYFNWAKSSLARQFLLSIPQVHRAFRGTSE
jgi:hypothetical protein